MFEQTGHSFMMDREDYIITIACPNHRDFATEMAIKHNELPDKKTGLARVIRAGKFSWQGLTYAVAHEEAFRQEVFLAAVLIPVTFFIPVDGVIRLLMIITPLLVMIVELLNSAIESAIDLASPEYHELAKQAKDMSSLAVLISFLVLISTWTYAIYIAISGN